MTYRRDIDGLRAMAILPILLYHAGIPGFSGGFVGVDIFFVISGFLITSIIMREVNEGSFSFVNFWARRARRILPAALVVIVFTLMAGWLLFAPVDYIELGRSARSQAFFSANFFFWGESGYFDGPSELKPLLHTWSLAVEEQFYIVFPLVLILLHKFLPNKKCFVLTLLFSLSLIASIIWVKDYPSATFYLLHTRAWELLLGSLLAFLPMYSFRYQWFAEIASGIGLATIAYCAISYDSGIVFPGISALPPTLATAVLIWVNGRNNTLVKQLLSLQPMVWVGLISYSLYLWHWPLIVFFRYSSVEELLLIDKLFLIGVSVILAYFSWKFVETPFRTKQLFATNKKILYSAFASILIVAMVGQQIRLAKGYPLRLPEHVRNYAIGAIWSKDQTECYKRNKTGELCRFGSNLTNKPELFFWGDSHAAALLPGVIEKTKEHGLITLHASKSSCLPILGLDAVFIGSSKCADFHQLMVDQISSSGVRHVLIAGAWTAYVKAVNSSSVRPAAGQADEKHVRVSPEVFRDYLSGMVKDLRAKNIHVWIVRQVPWQEEAMAHKLTKLAMEHRDTTGVGLPLEEHLSRQQFVNTVLDELAGEGVTILDPTPLMCTDIFCPAQKDGYSLYKDNDHLSVQGAMMLAELFEPIFDAVGYQSQVENEGFVQAKIHLAR
jgi:peptidoglycan/LPS O-acetylase OafA/YrhL